MTKILCLLVIAVLAAQICARPDDKEDAKKKDAVSDTKDKVKKAADDTEAVVKDPKDDDKKITDEADNVAKECEDPLKKAQPRKQKKAGIIRSAQKIVDNFFGLAEDWMPF